MQSLQREGNKMTTPSTPLFKRAIRTERDNYFATQLLAVAKRGADHIEFVGRGIYKVQLPGSVWATALDNGAKKAVFVYHSPADRDDDLANFVLSMKLGAI